MTAVAVYPPSGSNGELQFANSSGLLDAAQAFWDRGNSKLLISGSLEVLGTQTVIDTVHLQVEDSVIGLASGSAGEGAAGDRGFVFCIRGETNPSIYWDESAGEFVMSRVTNTPADTVFNDPLADGQGGFQNLRLGTVKPTTGLLAGSGTLSLSDVGSDVFFFVSGSLGLKGSSEGNVAVFSGDTVFSGSIFSGDSGLSVSSSESLHFTGSSGGSRFNGPIFADTGISGSLTRLPSGKSYILAGSGMIVTTGSEGQITLRSEAGENFAKKVQEINSEIDALTPVTISGLKLSDTSYNSERIDVFVNGQMMVSGSSGDYVIAGNDTDLSFYFDLIPGDIITVRTY